MAGRRQDDEEEDSRPLAHNPFGALSSLRDQLPEGDAPKGKRSRAPAKASVSIEKLGGEREMTVVSDLDLSPKVLENWLKAMAEELECRGAIDGGRIYLQGDQRTRVQAFLTKRRVGKVSIL